MSWMILTCLTLGVGVTALMANARSAQDCLDENEHYRLSIRFWTILAGLGFAVPLLTVLPLASWGMFATVGAQTAAVMACLPPLVLVLAGAGNAVALSRVVRRRSKALEGGQRATARVIGRYRHPLSPDLMALELEAKLPDPNPQVQDSYRPRDEQPTVTRRFVELAPADHWARFEPGSRVELAYDDKDPDKFAVLLFERPALAAASEVSALPAATEA